MTHNLSEVELTIVEMFQECCSNIRECAVNNKQRSWPHKGPSGL